MSETHDATQILETGLRARQGWELHEVKLVIILDDNEVKHSTGHRAVKQKGGNKKNLREEKICGDLVTGLEREERLTGQLTMVAGPH